MSESVRLLLHGAYAGTALFGATVVVLGGARPALVLVFVALGVVVQAVAEVWGAPAAAPVVALGVIFTTGGPVALAALVIAATSVVGVAQMLRARRSRLRAGERS